MSSKKDNYIEGGIEEGSKLFEKLLLDSVKNPHKQLEPENKTVAPKPGFCLKTTSEKGEKVFVNVCSSEGVLKPKDISEDELKEIWASGDATKFRIPMAIGDVHKERDKSGRDCSVYDIIINPSFLEKIEKSRLFKEFFITLVYEGLSSKHDLQLNVDYKILKNRKAIGTLQMQMVRTKSTPVILEMNQEMYDLEKEQLAEQQAAKNSVGNQLREVSTKRQNTQQITPKYVIIREPPTGPAEYLILEVTLPDHKSSKSLILDVGEDCCILTSSDGKLKLDLDLPEAVNENDTGAQFNRKTKVLTVTMPCI